MIRKVITNIVLVLALMFSTSLCFSQVNGIRKTARSPAVPAAKAEIKPQFAALALDEGLVAYTGWASEEFTSEAANKRALYRCEQAGGSGCKIVLTWTNGQCGFYRIVRKGEGSGAGWGFAKSPAEADIIASANVRKANKGLQAPTNSIHACNRIPSGELKLTYSFTPKPEDEKTECLVQFRLDIDLQDNRADSENWIGRYFSPVFQLSPSDCPKPLDASYSDYNQVSSTKPLDPSGLGVKYSKEYSAWISRQRPPSGTKFRNNGEVRVMKYNDKNLAEFLDDITDLKTHVPDSGLLPSRPICVGYQLDGVTPIKVYGTESCTGWVK